MLRFLLKHADVDLVQLLESSVPPVDLDRVAIFRQAVLRFNKEAIRYSLVLNMFFLRSTGLYYNTTI